MEINLRSGELNKRNKRKIERLNGRNDNSWSHLLGKEQSDRSGDPKEVED
jgi:hypothetical protein